LDRIKIIAEKLKTNHINKEELKVLSDLCYEYLDIFLVEGDKVIETDLVTQNNNAS